MESKDITKYKISTSGTAETQTMPLLKALNETADGFEKFASNTPMHRLVFIITIIGYIVIAYSGNMNDSEIWRYCGFILFSLFLCFVLNRRKEELFKLIFDTIILILFSTVTIVTLIAIIEIILFPQFLKVL